MKHDNDLLIIIVLLFAAFLCVCGLLINAQDEVERTHQHARQLEDANKALAEQLQRQSAICWSKETE